MGSGSSKRKYTGTIQYVDDGDRGYEGSIVQGLPNGYGTYKQFKGEWKDGTFIRGTMQTAGWKTAGTVIMTCDRWICTHEHMDTLMFAANGRAHSYIINDGTYVPDGRTIVKLDGITPFELIFKDRKPCGGEYTVPLYGGTCHFTINDAGDISTTITIYVGTTRPPIATDHSKIYEGNHLYFRAHGHGTYYHMDGHTPLYTGLFANERFHGRGITYDMNGNKTYEGYFNNGRMDGMGVMYFGGKVSEPLVFSNNIPMHAVSEMIPIPARTPATITTCAICYEEVVSTVFIPCRHCIACSKCSKKLDTCPACRARIDDRMKVYI
uniref:RING-type domain-containing protein n=1 Tax=viral metagenome TaxID=1070528 RepID=A0A6C0M2E4_9ZZZZ